MLGRLRSAHAALVAGLLAASAALTGCDVLRIGEVAQTIDDARIAIAAESTAWRSQLQRLSEDLNELESQAGKDIKDAVTSTANQVADLTAQAIELTDAKVQDRIAQAGTEFRCNTDFLKESVTAELQYLVDDLKFWETEKKHKNTPPVHRNCWVAPTALSLYPTDDGHWSVDSANMSDKGVIHLFGYAYRADALPTVTLQDLSGSVVRAATIKPAYVTRYQINVDISTETFAGVQPGSRLVLDWPDNGNDSTTITLLPRPRARLQIQETTFSPAAPKAGSDQVSLRVKVKNTGGDTSGPFTVAWTPDTTPGTRTYSITHDRSLRANESVDLWLGPHIYTRSGDIDSTVSISANGADSKILRLHVLPRPPLTEGTLSTGDCDAIDFKVDHNAVSEGEVEFVLQPGGNVTWWKAVFVPVTHGADVVGFLRPWPVLATETGKFVAVNDGALTGPYRGFYMERGTSAGGRIALADLDRSRALGFGKAKEFGNHKTLAFTWNALSADVIDPLGGSRVTLTWKQDGC
jgi:hypothetical protein